MKRLFLLLEKWLVPIALLIWGMEIVFLAFQLGVKEGADTYLYLRFAQNGTFGDAYVDAHYQWYRSYTLFLSLFYKAGLGWVWAITTQIILASSSLWALYDLAKRVGSQKAASWGLLLYVLWYDSHVWHFYLYSDSLFSSCSIWCLWACCRAKQTMHLLYVLPLVIFTLFIRPPGIVLPLIYAVAFLGSLPMAKWIKVGIAILCLGVCAFLVQHMLPTFELMETYRKGEVIYSYPAWNILPDASVVVPDEENSLPNLLWFVGHHPLYFFKLVLNKTVAFLVHAKPYYSWTHNMYIVLLLFPCYGLFVKGWKEWKDKEARWLLLGWCLGQTVIVALTIEDWDGRFLLPIVPYVFMGATIGIQTSLEKQRSRVESALI